jgi:hypothetical protein
MTVFFLALAAVAGVVVGFGGGYWLSGRVDRRRNWRRFSTSIGTGTANPASP